MIAISTLPFRLTENYRETTMESIDIGPKGIPLKQLYMNTDILPETVILKRLFSFIQESDTSTTPLSKVLRNVNQILTTVCNLKIQNQLQYLWVLEFSCKYTIIDIHGSDPFLFAKVLQKLRHFNHANIMCPVFLEVAIQHLNLLYGEHPEALQSTMSFIATTNLPNLFIFASLSSLAMKARLNLNVDSFFPWKVTEFLPHLKQILLHPKENPKETMIFLQLLVNYVTLNLNCRYIQRFKDDSNFAKYFVLDPKENAYCKKKIQSWTKTLLRLVLEQNPREEDTNLEVIRSMLKVELLDGMNSEATFEPIRRLAIADFEQGHTVAAELEMM